MAQFLRNTWYMVGWSTELDQAPIARTVAEIPVVVYRTQSGRAVALLDRCPHRFAPLSLGEVRGEQLRCKYHGLTFNAAGVCVENPLGGPIPAACKVASYPLVEQDTMLWVWLGDPTLADPAKITRFPWFQDPGMRVVRGYTPSTAHYELLTDNLMDLTHAKFLHPLFGGELYSPVNTMQVDGDTVLSKYLVSSVDNPEFPEVAWSAQGRKVDLWDDIRWHAPATLSLESGVTLAGQPRAEGCAIPSAHVITPADGAHSHYFWGSGIYKDSPMSDQAFVEVLSQAFDAEDKPMIEATFDRMRGRDFWSLNPVLLATDAPSVRVRRMLGEMLRQERAAQ